MSVLLLSLQSLVLSLLLALVLALLSDTRTLEEKGKKNTGNFFLLVHWKALYACSGYQHFQEWLLFRKENQDPTVPLTLCLLFLYKTGRFPDQKWRAAWAEFLSGWSRWHPVLPFLWFLSLKPGPLFTRSGILWLLQLTWLLLSSDFHDWKSAALHPSHSILTACGILITGCLFQTYASALLVALGAEKMPQETRDLQWLLASQDKSQGWHHLQLWCTDSSTLT